MSTGVLLAKVSMGFELSLGRTEENIMQMVWRIERDTRRGVLSVSEVTIPVYGQGCPGCRPTRDGALNFQVK